MGVVFFSYLREVGFPDNILEARVARLNLYRTLMSGGPYNQNENIPAAITSSTAHIEGVRPHLL